MKTRPWPLVILALFQAVAPAFNLWFCARVLNTSVEAYASALWAESTPRQLFEFYALGPIAGLAIFRTRRWSYPLFLAITSFTAWRNYQSHVAFPGLLSLPLLFGAYAANAALVAYFLLPAVRLAYFNPRVRWWESQPRFQVELDARAGETPVRIRNLSEGGAFIEAAAGLPQGAFTLSFEWQGERYAIAARVVHRRADGRGLGLQFAPSRVFRKRMRALAHRMAAAGCAPTIARGPWHLEFRGWFLRLVRTGRGWVPETPSDVFAAPRAEKRARRDRAA